MATPFESTPKWFDAEYYLSSKLAQLLEDDPKGGWTRDTMLAALNENGFTNPYDHYLSYGDGEGLSPNPLFSNDEYLVAKTAQMGSTWTTEMVAKAIKDAGLTLMQHYELYGSSEGLSPSSAFNQDKYYEAKLDQLQLAEPDKGWTLETMKEAFAKAGLTPLDHYLTYAKEEGLDKYDYSDNGAPIPHPGNTKIVLTTGVDTVTPDATEEALKTSDRDDVISGVVGSSTKGTLNANDVIDGGAGQDTLKLDMQANFNGFKDGGVKNVETIVLNNASSYTFDAKGVEGANIYVVDGGEKGNVTIKNVESTATGYAIKQAGGDFTAQIVDTALTGKTDSVSVTLNGAGTDTSRVNVTVKGSTSGVVEGLALIAQGANQFLHLTEAHETVSVMGASAIDVTTTGELKTFDASAATGKVTATLSGTSLKTLNGGAADDTFTVTSFATGAVVDGGAGKDTLVLAGLGSGSLVNSTISDVETFTATAFASGVATVNLAKVTGLETFTLKSVATSTGGIALKGDLAELNLQVTNDAAAAGSFSYDGTGVLNVSHTGGSKGNNTALTAITANKVTELTITNAADSGDFTVNGLAINSVDTLKLNTGAQGDLTVNGGGTAKLAALTSVTLQGEGNADLDLGTGVATKLTTVDASALQGTLTLDLSSLSGNKGVTVTMGDYGTGTDGLLGTSAKDTFVLGAGDDTVVLKGGSTNAAADIIKHFEMNDKLVLAATSAGSAVTTYLSAPASDFAADQILGFKSTGLTGDKMYDLTLAASGAVASAIITKMTANAHGGFTSGDMLYFAIDNGASIGFYGVKVGGVNDTSAVGASDLKAITLLGIVEGISYDTITSGNFA